MDEKTLDRIDRYLRKEMSSKESLYFEQDALNDKELLKEVETTYRIKRRLADRHNKLYKTGQWESKRKNNVIMVSTITSIAALFVLGVFFINPLKDTSVQLSDRINMHNSKKACLAESKVAPEIEDMESPLRTVEHAVKAGKNKKAVAVVEDLERARVIPSLYEISQERLIMSNTQNINESSALNDAYELHWYKILSLVKLGKMADALEALNLFKTIDGIYKQQADSLISEINITPSKIYK